MQLKPKGERPWPGTPHISTLAKGWLSATLPLHARDPRLPPPSRGFSPMLHIAAHTFFRAASRPPPFDTSLSLSLYRLRGFFIINRAARSNFWWREKERGKKKEKRVPRAHSTCELVPHGG